MTYSENISKRQTSKVDVIIFKIYNMHNLHNRFLMSISLVKTLKNNQIISKKEPNFFHALFEYMYRSRLFYSYYKYHLNLQSMYQPNK